MRLIDADELKEIIKGNENYIDWQKKEIIACIECVDTVEVDIEKQIPRPVDGVWIEVNDEEYLSVCPTCGSVPISNFDSYCRHCGQRLEWEE